MNRLADRNFEMIETNGIRLRCVVEGDPSAPLVILMHGAPQCWYLWRHQIDPLLKQGWRVCVPDQRGYGMSDCPPNVSDYGILDLCADIDGLATALGHDDYVLGIHDWGAIAGWNVALLYPDRVRAVLALSIPYLRDPNWPAMCTQEFWGDRFFYWEYYCREVGLAEREMEADLRSYGSVALIDRLARSRDRCCDFGQIASASSSNAAARRRRSHRASMPSS